MPFIFQNPMVIVVGALVMVVIAASTGGSARSATADPAQVSPEMKKYLERIHPRLYWEIAAMLLLLGGLMTLIFIRNEVRQSSNLFQQMCVSAVASMLLGFGFFFMF